jgi:hypothetical protein
VYCFDKPKLKNITLSNNIHIFSRPMVRIEAMNESTKFDDRANHLSSKNHTIFLKILRSWIDHDVSI